MKLQLGPEDPLVRQALSGIYKSSCGRPFFRIDSVTGEHRKVSVARELASLDITHDNRRALIRSYVFQELPYASERMKAKAAAAKSKMPRATLQVAEADGYDFPEDELPEEESQEGKPVNTKILARYSLVETNSGSWGCYDGTDGYLTLFHTKPEANAFIHDLIYGDSFMPFYGGKH